MDAQHRLGERGALGRLEQQDHRDARPAGVAPRGLLDTVDRRDSHPDADEQHRNTGL